MGLYDAVDRGGAGRKKERTLRRPLLIAAAILAAVIALIAWSCRYFFQYRSWDRGHPIRPPDGSVHRHGGGRGGGGGRR